MPTLPAGLPPALRRAPARAAAAAVLVAAAYSAGVVTGATEWPGSHADASPPAAKDGTDLDAVRDRLAGSALDAVPPSKLDEAAIRAMVGALDDPWSAYYAGDGYAKYQETLDGEYNGVGLLLRERSTGEVYVGAVEPGSPAAAAGIRTGSDVLAVDGRTTIDQSAGEVAGELRGAAGTAVTVTLSNASQLRSVHLTRVRLTSRDVTVDWLTPHVARITIADFTRGVGHRTRVAATRLLGEHVGGIVLDLRGNPGGLLDEAVEAASAFLDGGPVVSYERRNQPPVVRSAERGGDTTTPMAVLVDGGTASAAEVLAAALQDRGRAVVVGSRTFGKGTVQQPVQLSNGAVAEMTVAHYRTPSGRSLDGVGLEPDIVVSPGSSPLIAQRRAVEVLSGLLADADTGGRG